MRRKTMKQKISIAMSLAVILPMLLTSIDAQAIQADITPAECTPPPPNMVSWWPGDGNAADLIGTNDGTLQGGVTFVEGQVGQAFQFDGTGAVEIADSPSLNVQAFTIDAWVFPTAADGGTDVIINKEPVSVFSTFTTQYEIGIRGSFEPGMGIIPEGNFAFFIGGITGLPNEYRAWVDGGGPIPHNEWTHVALVFDGTSARTYINGAQTRVVAGLGGAVPVSSGPLKIGSRSAIQTDLVSPEPFNGRIDEVELFNRALTSTEINAIYSAGPSGKCKTDTTPPVITFIYSGGGTDNGWYTSFGEASWYVSDDESPISSSSGCDPTLMYANTAGTTLTCSATSAGGTSTESVTMRIDGGAPTISASYSPAANEWGWNNTDVTVTFTCEDDMSGVMYCEPEHIFSDEGAGQGGGMARVVDWAWHDDRLGYGGINIDKTPPTVSLVGGPANGGTYYFGFVPAAPTCSASDALSGLVGSCSVSGYSTAVGSHTVTASATDKAGNSASASATYAVLPWTLSGFQAPVEMNGVYNIVSGGSPVALKFEVFAGATELSDTSAVKSLTYALVSCTAGTKVTGGTSFAIGGTALRYDTAAGLFIQKWQTPRQAGACYRVMMTTRDGSSLVAFFKLK